MSTELWEFKYEPKVFSEMILNENIKPKLEKALKEVPSFLLYGTPGVGKGTFTKILLRETGYDHMWINASDETGIDNIRQKVRSFSTAMGISPLKIVVLNEADSLSSGDQGAQKILRQLMEDVQKITRFILLCNYENKIIPELKSRCTPIKIDNPPIKEIALFSKRILENEKIQFKNETLISIVKKCYPDIRSTIKALKENVINGKLVTDHISSSEGLWEQILNMIKNKNIEGVRKALKSNYIDYVELYKYLYENVGEFKEPGGAILLIGQHLVWDGIVAIKEINFMHMVIEMVWEKII